MAALPSTAAAAERVFFIRGTLRVAGDHTAMIDTALGAER